ncbi:hypothetical protein RND81_12G052100 [Saponaria officinalis]|uniref:S-adenosyl-L-methionine-dependent methyltransferase superfamily protein n=1 Tax=Saponaria officinalis TaxID=3572 RepID=A0AAW1H5G9_SAPOF
MWLWRVSKLSPKTTLRRLSSTTIPKHQQRQLRQQHLVRDEGSWAYSPEWWGSDADHRTHSVFRATSDHGNGVVSVLSYPSSFPSAIHWPKTENWLQKRYTEACSNSRHDQDLKVLGYQWRVLRFNDVTRQSTVKVLATAKISDPSTVYYMQQPHCLAIPYVKSMVAAGLTALSTCNYDLTNAVGGNRKLRVLCVGHGGGSLPLFLASKIQGAVIDIVEIDPLVISASIDAMGFPSCSVATLPGQHALSRATTMDDVLWKGIHERLFLHESDAEKFIQDSSYLYDIVFIDAYDGDDIFPRKLWDPDSPFMESLGRTLHPSHGTVVVNLHSDADIVSPDQSNLPMCKYVSQVSRAYKSLVAGKNTSPGLGFTVSVPWVCNTTLVVCRGFLATSGALNRDSVLNSLSLKSLEVVMDLDMPFSCLDYLKRGFFLLD